MRQETINIYKFSELSEESKQKAIDKWYETEDYPFLTEDLTELIIANENFCFDDIQLQYSLSCCQGDGLSFSGKLDIEKFLRFHFSKKLKDSQIKIMSDLLYFVKSTGNTGHYCYAHKNQIEYEYNDYKSYPHLEKLFETEILPEIQDYYMRICKDAEKEGYVILDYRMNFQEFEDFTDSNNYEFYRNGVLV
jgi:hypothetical protein